MLKESVFYKFLNRRKSVNLSAYLKSSEEDVDYINWNQFVLPNDHGDAEQEYLAIRHSCALFDVSPMRKYQIQGSGAGVFLDQLLTRPVSEATPMHGIYVAYCNEDGSLKDDSILYKYAEDDYLLMPSDIDHSAYFESLRRQWKIANLSIVECSGSLAGMAIQGPLSATLLKQMGFGGIELLKPFEVANYSLEGETAISSLKVARMGFTADLGYECWMGSGLSKAFEQRISLASHAMGITLLGYGLSALEACRLEAGFIVAGWDCATEADPEPGFERSPFELDIGWLVNLDAAAFVGRDALIKQKQEGGRFVRRSFKMGSALKPEDGADIWGKVDSQEILIGSINCSSWSWGLNNMIGNASIIRDYGELKQAWLVVDNNRLDITLSQGPLLSFERQKKTPAKIY